MRPDRHVLRTTAVGAVSAALIVGSALGLAPADQDAPDSVRFVEYRRKLRDYIAADMLSLQMTKDVV